MRRLAFFTVALFASGWASTALGAPRVSAEPSSIVLGGDATVLLRVGGEVDDLRASVSAGSLADEGEDGGQRLFRWTPPAIGFPSTGVLLFWSASAKSPAVTVVRIPLLGKTTLEMDTEPGAEVRVTVGGSQFGPVKANQRGRVRVPIAVPPGATSAQVLARSGGRQTTRAVPLQVPVTHPFAIAAGPEPLPREGGWLVVAGARPGAIKAAQVRADGATFERTGIDDTTGYRLIPDAGRTAPITVTVSARDESTVQAVVGIDGGDEAPSTGDLPAARSAPIVPQALAGAFFSGGANSGLALELGVAWPLSLRPLPVSLELSAGLRRSAFSSTVGGLGRAEASLLAFPLSGGARVRLLDRGPWALDARAGIGFVPFRHTFSADFQEDSVQTGIGFDAFAAAQGLYRIGPVEAVFELRGAFTQARTPVAVARPGGVLLTVGARWWP